jgi:hypothetical protein
VLLLLLAARLGLRLARRVTLQQPDLISGHLPSCDGPNIRCFDPSLTAVWTAYPAEPLLSFFYSPVERASRGPRR